MRNLSGFLKNEAPLWAAASRASRRRLSALTAEIGICRVADSPDSSLGKDRPYLLQIIFHVPFLWSSSKTETEAARVFVDTDTFRRRHPPRPWRLKRQSRLPHTSRLCYVLRASSG